MITPCSGRLPMSARYSEAAFEAAIEATLLAGGYRKGDPAAFDRKRALDIGVLLEFVRDTQPDAWAYLENIQKDRAGETLVTDLVRALDSEHEGCLAVLRHGFKCYGKTFQVAYFAPASGLNPDSARLYTANRLTITRQLHYSQANENSLDMVLGLNGIPLVTLELKNPLTGQNVTNAIRQYREDRDPAEQIFRFGTRTLVHFAVDPDLVYMTTKLVGPETHFLPFNKGNGQGAGNPPNPDGCRTAYLWESVLQRDSLLEILARFVHLHVETKEAGGTKIIKKSLIFPRYHQLEAVRLLIADARTAGSGKNYLIQHSAGSGKSNTIAWLAHRLATLHDAADAKVFDSVIVLTDRLVLDQQLQDTVYQFEHRQGFVQKINDDSTQLAKALVSGVPIIISTMQKFGYVTDKIGTLPAKRYAVIVDEAHSSQGGEGAAEVKGVLSRAVIEDALKNRDTDGEVLTETSLAVAEAGLTVYGDADWEEELVRQMKRRGRQPNLSFFAFTATPKYKTLEMFGLPGPDGKPAPFHLYSMRQAIDEQFILDVLAHYMTYKAYFGLVKTIADDPDVEKSRAAKALARFASLHPHNIAQKTEVIIEHFRSFTRHKIGGRAKAMVVTSSRLHAVRYKKAFDNYIREKGYHDIGVLIAFSGSLRDPDEGTEHEYTEVGMNNGLAEKSLPKEFANDQWHFLIVADKYQTGFDQPLLHTMYVDKRLDGIQAVQTLSRLNRICPGKENTFVLDFVNEPDGIREAFQPFYEQTQVGEQVEPGQLYDLQAKLDGMKVYDRHEVDEFARLFYSKSRQTALTDHPRLNACLDPVVNRFGKLEPELQDAFRHDATAFRNLYAFMAQVMPFVDADLEKRYTLLRFLLAKLPRDPNLPGFRFEDEVALKYYRLQKQYEGAITLEQNSAATIDGPGAVGTGKAKKEMVGLESLIEILNERLGTDFTFADQLFFEQIREEALADPELQQAALANSEENFGYVLKKAIETLFIDRMDANEEITARYLNDEAFRTIILAELLKSVYRGIRNPA